MDGAAPIKITRSALSDSTPAVRSLYVLAMAQGSLFTEPQPPVPNEEVVEALRAAIARAGRLPRSADLLLCSVCAQYLVDELRGAGLEVVRRPPVSCGR